MGVAKSISYAKLYLSHQKPAPHRSAGLFLPGPQLGRQSRSQDHAQREARLATILRIRLVLLAVDLRRIFNLDVLEPENRLAPAIQGSKLRARRRDR